MASFVGTGVLSQGRGERGLWLQLVQRFRSAASPAASRTGPIAFLDRFPSCPSFFVTEMTQHLVGFRNIAFRRRPKQLGGERA
jgi:hypothetical protein